MNGQFFGTFGLLILAGTCGFAFLVRRDRRLNEEFTYAQAARYDIFERIRRRAYYPANGARRTARGQTTYSRNRIAGRI